MGVKIELEKKEIGYLKIALNIATKDYNKTIENIQKDKKLKKAEKEDLIKDIMEEKVYIEKLKKFFSNLK